MRRTAAMIAALVISAGALSGCADKIDGTPVTSTGAAGATSTAAGGSSAAAERVSGMEKVQCRVVTPGDTGCISRTSIPASAAKPVSLRAGDAIAIASGSNQTIVSVGALVTDGSTTWALAGAAIPRTREGRAAIATDGTTLGTVASVLLFGESEYEVVAVKLASNVHPTATSAGASTAPAAEHTSSTFTGAVTTTPTKCDLIHGGETCFFPVPTMQPGDGGGPVVVGDQLVGMVSIASGSVIPWPSVASQLSKLGGGAHLLTK
ncbi:hypothetical protein [Tsukamurella spumae]|uniref:Serine protease n=1 Tax=Tsukamurella spumae TaxID=44753 RepID=A0A846X5Y8_9ACTN|nr:hypothetical protein [Tsukamurella spumae]NKY19729.1 hypothetical protein [Tsukamurella spumae]